MTNNISAWVWLSIYQYDLSSQPEINYSNITSEAELFLYDRSFYQERFKLGFNEKFEIRKVSDSYSLKVFEEVINDGMGPRIVCSYTSELTQVK
jgi:hypothetical protein